MSNDLPTVVGIKTQPRRPVTGAKPTSAAPQGLPPTIYAGNDSTYQNVRICCARSLESTVEAMADTGQFTVSAGYAKINTVEVPQRRGIAIFAGFDPVTATLPITLDRLGQQGDFAVEEACAMLEYMAGQGRGPGGQYEGAAQQGGRPKPLVLEAILAPTLQGGQPRPSHLVPMNYNFAGGHTGALTWFITGLEWGDSIRSSGPPYQRVRQKATVTFTEYDPADEPPIPSRWVAYTVGPGQGRKGESPYEIVKKLNWLATEVAQRASELRKHFNSNHHGKRRLGTINSRIAAGSRIKVPVEG